MHILKIAEGVSLPPDLSTQSVTILAKRRVGKSYTMRRMWEQMLKGKQHVVVVDPKGDQWGIRSSSNGKKPGFPILILRGEHGDLPLEKGAGELIAKLIVEQRVNTLLDTSHFFKSSRAEFMAHFLELLYRLKAQEKYRTPLSVIIDEADEIAPQRPQRGEERMLGAIDDIVRRGGQRGLGSILVTQRSASLNKNVLTQSEMLILLRTIAPQDLAAIKAWIDVHGTPEQQKIIMAELPSLPRGDAYFWSPAWPTEKGMFVRAHVLPIETFDSAKTPEEGEKRITPKSLADVDLEALKGQMAATIERKKAEDPKLLRQEITRLRSELDNSKRQGQRTKDIQRTTERQPSASVSKSSVRIEKIEVPAIGKRTLEKFQKGESAMRKMLRDARAFFKSADETSIRVLSILDILAKEIKKVQQTPSLRKPTFAPTIPRLGVPSPATLQKMDDSGILPMGLGERRILTAIAQDQGGLTREHITVQTGYKRSTRDTYIQRLMQRGYVSTGAKITATSEGIAALGSDYQPLPTGREFIEYHLRELPEGEAKLFKILVDADGREVERDTLTEATGYQRSTRDTYLQRLASRQLIEQRGRGLVKASDLLFL